MLRTIVPFFIVGLLTACNGGEDFPGAGSGPIVGLPGGDQPIPGLSEDAVVVELVAAINDNGTIRTARVTNLGYECTGSRSFIPAAGEGEGLARCHPSADKVSFFIGADGLTGERVYLGTIYLPGCTGRSSGSDCAGGTGFFQFSVADMIPGTAPKRERSDNVRVRNRVALLAALDANPDNKVRIDIPAAAHSMVDQAPEAIFSESYSTFVARWATWLANVSAFVDPPLAEPLAFPATAEESGELALAAMQRSATGTFEIVHGSFAYGIQVPGLPQTEIRLPFSVAGGGQAFGVGIQAGRTTDSAESPLDFLGLGSGIFLDQQMVIRKDGNEDFWESQSVLDSANGALSFSGRMIGVAVYDGLYSIAEPTETDYTLDYKDAAVAEMSEVDKGLFTGTSFGADFNSFPAPYRVQRTGLVSAFLHPEVMQVRPQFYRMTIYRACAEDLDACTGRPIPEAEKNLNYLSIGYIDDLDEIAIFEPEFEVPRDTIFSSAPGLDPATFQVEILDDGTVVTDSDANCSPVDGMLKDLAGIGRQEYRVGFVSRTHHPAANEKSMNLALFMAGPAVLGAEEERIKLVPSIPHYGTRIEGRINLELPTMPMYRLGDDSFDGGIRAIWLDNFDINVGGTGTKVGFQRELFTRGLPPDPVLADQLLAATLTQGSVEGVAVDAVTCEPLAAPAP